MSATPVQAALLTVEQIFTEAGTSYVIPIYQRNYAWREEQIEQLVDDVWTAARDDGQDQYFLGNLVVAERKPGDGSADGRSLEVIDGQQRLTTLSLLLRALGGADFAPKLRYASRPAASAALCSLGSSDDEDGTGIHTGYKIVRQALEAKVAVGGQEKFAEFLRSKVRLVRATLLGETDLNRYFEIMNTRGQQLQQVDIVKARLMRHLARDPGAQDCFAWIWDACRDMDAYVQMSLTRVREDRTGLRALVFGREWDRLEVAAFPALHALHRRYGVASAGPAADQVDDGRSLTQALADYAGTAAPDEEEDQESARFRSPIEFPSLLLHVLKVQDSRSTGGDDSDDSDDSDEGRLDDNKLIKLFDARFGQLNGVPAADAVKGFAEELLRCRFVFDNYLIKREYTATNGDDGDWSLKRLVRSRSLKAGPAYRAGFARGDSDSEDGDEDEDEARDLTTGQVLMLQSMLRVTYTSPRTMHWMTAVLRIPGLEQPDSTSARRVQETLQAFARARVSQAFFQDVEPTGFGIERIVFTYLDYLIAKDVHPGYRFTFRSSVEHFFPQWPDRDQGNDVRTPRGLHSFGNLALISVGANSKFSNNLPHVKVTFERLIVQSPKLQHMAAQTRAADGSWDDAAIESHGSAMVALLRADLGLRHEP